ncbi:MAG: hypothetical protein ACJ789_11070 [Thermomicrobiales bacterium]
MTYTGIEIIDGDWLDGVADILDDVAAAAITCPECHGRTSITDYSPGLGWIDLPCPCCAGYGTILASKLDGGDGQPAPPTPAAPAVAVVIPLFRCATCRDAGRVVKPSVWFPGETIEGFYPDCTPQFDFALRCFVNCGATEQRTGEATPPTAPIPFDRTAHCRKIASYGGVGTVRTHGLAHMRAIGDAGARVTIARHGAAYWRGRVTAKGCDGMRRPDLPSDLAAGRTLADLDRAA